MSPVLYIFRESVFKERLMRECPDVNIQDVCNRLKPNLQFIEDKATKMKYGLFLCERTDDGDDTLDYIVYEAFEDEDLAAFVLESIDDAWVMCVIFE